MLHGELKVNHHQFAKWRAYNRETTGDGYTNYECKVWYTNTGGYHFVADFFVRHKYGDGALALLAAIMVECQNHLRPVGFNID